MRPLRLSWTATCPRHLWSLWWIWPPWAEILLCLSSFSALLHSSPAMHATWNKGSSHSWLTVSSHLKAKKNNVKDYTPPVIWSGPQETSLLFLSVTRPHLCGGALQMVGSMALGAKIPKLHICDNLQTQEWSYGNWLIISFLNRRTTRSKILRHTYRVSTHWDLEKKKKKDGNKQMSPNLIQLKRISFRNKMIGGENIKHPHISQVRKVSKLN